MVERQVGDKLIRLIRGDLTDLAVEALVHDIDTDMKLGAGFGSAIQRRGGIVIQKELDAIGECPTGEAVVTQAGILKADYIIHVNGPKFREEDEEDKLRKATKSALRRADEKGIKRLAIPPIGNEYIAMLKDSALVSVTGFVREILWRAQRVGRANFKNLEALVIAAFFYWMLTLVFTAVQARIEARFEQDEGGVKAMSH